MLKFWELGLCYVVPKHLSYWMVFFPIMVRVWGSMFWAFAFHYHNQYKIYIHYWYHLRNMFRCIKSSYFFKKGFILNKAFLKIHFKIWICKKLWNEIEFIILHEQSLLLQHEGVMRWLKPLISLQLWTWGGFNFLLQHLILAMGPHCVGGIWSLPFEKWEGSYTYE